MYISRIYNELYITQIIYNVNKKEIYKEKQSYKDRMRTDYTNADLANLACYLAKFNSIC